jgi:hypothetical protein
MPLVWVVPIPLAPKATVPLLLIARPPIPKKLRSSNTGSVKIVVREPPLPVNIMSSPLFRLAMKATTPLSLRGTPPHIEEKLLLSAIFVKVYEFVRVAAKVSPATSKLRHKFTANPPIKGVVWRKVALLGHDKGHGTIVPFDFVRLIKVITGSCNFIKIDVKKLILQQNLTLQQSLFIYLFLSIEINIYQRFVF